MVLGNFLDCANGGLMSLKLPNPGSDNFSDKEMHAQWPPGALEPDLRF
jgi:hypothetical protein